VLTKDQANTVIDRVRAASKADEVHVSLDSGESANIRFARNSPSTSGNAVDTSMSVRSVFGKRSGSVRINQLDDETVERAVRRSEEIAKLAPEDPEEMPALGPQSYTAIPGAYRDSVLERGQAQMAQGVKTCIEAALAKDLVGAGFANLSAGAEAIGNSAGLFGYHRATSAHFSQTVRTPDGRGSGWASDAGREVGELDFGRNASVAIDKAIRSADPQPLDPGKYVTILEPACVANLVGMLLFSMSARSADEGRSFFAKQGGGNRLGETLFPKTVNIHSDPTDATVPGSPWSGDSLPQVRRDWIKDGAVANLSYDRFWAQKNNVAPVPSPSNTIMAGGTGTTEDLIKSTKRGVLITSLWYIRSVDPKSMLYTGLTRDGVFWIENGEIVRPLTNFRWNDSPVAVLKGIEAMSESARVSPRSWRSNTVRVPALRVKEFELSSVSDAV
jgi:predicted Zn-dependent protease